MKIEVAGNCCAACHATYEAIKQAAHEIDDRIEVVHIEDIMQILKRGIVQTPAVFIDGKQICSGKHLSKEKAKEMIISNR